MPKILIVDDSAVARRIATRCITIARTDEIEFVEAEHGKDALEKLKAGGFDCVVSDLNMPVMDGETLLRFLRCSPRHCELPVVVLSSLVNDSLSERLRAAGAHVVLRKPTDPGSMRDALNTALGAAA